MAPSLPDTWHEVEDLDLIFEKYRARNPTLFVREGQEVGVQVLPISPSSPHAAEEFRVDAIRGDEDEIDREIPIESFDEKQDALGHALEFANRYEEEYGAREDEAAALDAAAEAV